MQHDSFGFLAPDKELACKILEGGDNCSRGADKWALSQVTDFHKSPRLDMAVELGDPPSNEIFAILVLFFECVAKQDGGLYPPGTLYNLLSALNCVLRRAQELRIMSSGIDNPPLNMKLSPLFCGVVLACVLSMMQSRAAGIGIVRCQVLCYALLVCILGHAGSNAWLTCVLSYSGKGCPATH